MSKYLFGRRPSVRVVLLTLLALIGGWAVIVSLERAADSFQAYRQSQHQSEYARLTTTLLTAGRHIMFERGRTLVVLRAPEKITGQNLSFLAERRRESDAAWLEVQDQRGVLSEAEFADLLKKWETVKQLRIQVDHAVVLPPAVRDTKLATRFLLAINDLIHEIQVVSSGNFRKFRPGETATRVMLVASTTLELRNTVGVDVSIVAQALAVNKAPTEASLFYIHELRGKEGVLWQELDRLTAYLSIGDLSNTVKKLKEKHLTVLLPLQDIVLASLNSVDGRQVTFSQFTDVSTPIQDEISSLMILAEEQAIRLADESMAQSRRVMVENFAAAAFILLLLALAAYYVTRRVVLPLERVNGVLRRLMANAGDESEEGNGNEIERINASAAMLERTLIARAEFEAKYIKSDSAYRNLIENSPDPIYRYDLSCRRVYVNPIVERTSGKSAAMLLGKTPTEAALVPSDESVKVQQSIQRCLDTGVMTEVDVLFVAPDGSERYFQNIHVPEFGADGSIEGVLCIGRDITERKKSEEALQRSEQLTRAVIDATPDWIFIKDQQHRYQLVNKGYANALHLAPEDFIGKNDLDLGFPEELVKGNPEKGIRGFWADDRLVLDSNETQVYSDDPATIDGVVHTFHTIKVPLRDASEKPRGILAFARDITERKQMETELQRTTDFQKLLLEGLRKSGMWQLIIENGKVIYHNNINLDATLGYSVEDIDTSSNFIDLLIHPDERARMAEIYQQRLLGNAVPESYEMGVIAKDGSRREYRLYANLIPDSKPPRTMVLGMDITERKRMEEALVARESESRTLVDNSPDTISRYDRACRRSYVNPAFAALAEGGAPALLGKTPTECPGGRHADIYETKIQETFARGENTEFELNWPDQDGREICSHIRLTPEYDATGAVVSVLAVGRDITELNSHRKRVYQMAFYDSLTSLPNRALFNDRLRQMISDASWHQQLAGVMLLDLDRFKAVNDALGHPAGDVLLREAAARLVYCVRGYDTVARLGGDEFAILLPEIRSGDDLGRVANKIVEAFNEPFLLEGKEVFVTSSIGISVYPADSDDSDDLLQQADSAMYLAKRSGRNTFRFYSKDLTSIANERLLLEGDLRRGFGRGELELYYQPKVELADGAMIGSEALLRWNHPQRGMVAPDKFISIAEESGLIVDIGEWVLRDACRVACEWNDHGKPLHKVAINLSARQFQSNDLVKTVRKILDETHCYPEWIELEITESLLLDEDGEVLATLEVFREMGITIAIDDFGTGYSSLSYLARFPIDTLKIDRSFISKLTESGHHSELVKAIISIAHSLDQKVVAEGVETAKQAVLLQTYGCHIAQGYLYSKPVPKLAFEELPKMFELGTAVA